MGCFVTDLQRGELVRRHCKEWCGGDVLHALRVDLTEAMLQNETQFVDGAYIYSSDDKEEDEVIVLENNENVADVAPVKAKELIDLTSESDSVIHLESEEVEVIVLETDTDGTEGSDITPI
ncbi:unnamed protein product [Cuscuta campestris]|uniref:Uncharacterized protein n=1 Tax=Cuscuta campestris TaxID=132261 RepID=A0A484MG55_9ASTE|nr:unnamed protein product [Cuscuta campestris]